MIAQVLAAHVVTAQVVTELAAAGAICGGLWKVIGAIEGAMRAVTDNTKAVAELAGAVDDLSTRVDLVERGLLIDRDRLEIHDREERQQ